jgi:hypothetical protein
VIGQVTAKNMKPFEMKYSKNKDYLQHSVKCIPFGIRTLQ